MQSSVLEETQAFITRQREALEKERADIFSQQEALQAKLDAVNEMLRKFDAFEGKPAPTPRPQARTRRAAQARKGSKRDELLAVIKQSDGLTRSEILDKMGLKGNKAGEMSVSNALTAMKKANQVRQNDAKKYVAA